jgi:tetratricopeptide (TPR) repeat protein
MARQNVLTRAKKKQVEALLQQQRLQEARDLLIKICRTDKRDSDARLQLAVLHGQLGDYPQAEQCARQVLSIQQQHPSALYLLAMALGHQNKSTEAIDCYEKVIAQQPEFTEALVNLGNMYGVSGQLDKAAAVYSQALVQRPRDPDLLASAGVTWLELGETEQAIQLLEQAPASTENLMNLGIAYAKQDRPDEAVAALTKALSRNPDLAQAHFNLGKIYRQQDLLDKALHSYRQALALQPGNRDFAHNLALVELLLADFAPAWKHFYGRPTRQVSAPDTLPFDLHGRKILLLGEQGLGDEIFFLRFAQQLKQRGADISYNPAKKIASLLQRLDIIDHFPQADEEPDDVDYRFSIADLPLVTGMSSIEDIPPPLALVSDPERRQRAQDLLARAGPAPYFGVTWRAGTAPDRTDGTRQSVRRALYKQIPPQELAKTLQAVTGTILILQREPMPEEIDEFEQTLGRKAHDFSGLNDNLEDMLLLLDLIDEYVCVSNTNVHLRAGLGKPCRVLVPHPPEWRWLASGDHSPWFPGCSVYRQTTEGDWSPGCNALRADLAELTTVGDNC